MSIRVSPTHGANFIDYAQVKSHSDYMIMRVQTSIVAIASGYLGLLLLCIRLLYQANPATVGVLQFDIVHNECNAHFIDVIAKILELQISMYLLKGLITDGVTYAAIFSCLLVCLSELGIIHGLARVSFKLLKNRLFWQRLVRYFIVPGLFCAAAVINAYFCHPVGVFLFSRWLMTEAIPQYFIAGLLCSEMGRLIMQIARRPGNSPARFGVKVVCTLYLFKILGDFWPDMTSPLAAFALGSIKDNSGTCIYGHHPYHSYLANSALSWDAFFFLFMFFAAGATQLGACRLVKNTLKLERAICAKKSFSANLFITLAVATLMTFCNLLLTRGLLETAEGYQFTLSNAVSESTSTLQDYLK